MCDSNLSGSHPFDGHLIKLKKVNIRKVGCELMRYQSMTSQLQEIQKKDKHQYWSQLPTAFISLSQSWYSDSDSVLTNPIGKDGQQGWPMYKTSTP